jgi:alpha-beta hydrolase superfamily lysophospholipase
MAKLMDKLLPAFCMNNGLDIDLLSQDEEVVKAYKTDPLVHDRTSARLGMFILSKGEMVISQASNNKVPILVMIGSKEGIVNKEAVDNYCEQASFVDYKVWPDLYHEIHNEPQKEQVFKHTLTWIKHHL